MFSRQASLVCTLALLAIPAHSAPQGAFSCVDLRKATQKLQVHAVNIANHATTRTPQGGPYKPVELRCKEMYCETVVKDDFKLVYDPSHPDSNKAGYVQIPRVDVAAEYAAINSAAAEVKLLAATGACGASALSSGTMALVKYDSGTSILSDVMNFSADGRLTSWSRTARDGKAEHYAFSADGTILKGAEPTQRAPGSATNATSTPNTTTTSSTGASMGVTTGTSAPVTTIK